MRSVDDIAMNLSLRKLSTKTNKHEYSERYCIELLDSKQKTFAARWLHITYSKEPNFINNEHVGLERIFPLQTFKCH